MATTNITMRIDEALKLQLQELVSNLGMDVTTFFTMAAKQAVREQAIPFKVTMRVEGTDNLREQAYRMAEENTKCNESGRPVISENDEWNKETEWEDMFHEMKGR